MTQDMSGSRRSPGTTGTGATNDIADQTREKARQAQAKAGDIASQAREQVGTQLSGQKDRVAEGLGGMAQALRQTGQQMRDQDQLGLTGYVDRAASQVESFSSYLRENDMGRVVDDVERFARREPALFLGGAFVLGLLGARFLKSSRPRPRYDESYYGASSAYETRYRPYYTGYAGGPDSSGYDPAREGYGAGSTGYGAEGKPRSTTNTGQGSSGQAGRRGAGIYDADREGS
jgi:hypothetical protein